MRPREERTNPSAARLRPPHSGLPPLCPNRTHAQLREHCGHVEVMAHYLDLAVFDFDDSARPDLDGLAGRGDLARWRLKGAAVRPAPRHFEDRSVPGDMRRIKGRL